MTLIFSFKHDLRSFREKCRSDPMQTQLRLLCEHSSWPGVLFCRNADKVCVKLLPKYTPVSSLADLATALTFEALCFLPRIDFLCSLILWETVAFFCVQTLRLKSWRFGRAILSSQALLDNALNPSAEIPTILRTAKNNWSWRKPSNLRSQDSLLWSKKRKSLITSIEFGSGRLTSDVKTHCCDRLRASFNSFLSCSTETRLLQRRTMQN